MAPRTARSLIVNGFVLACHRGVQACQVCVPACTARAATRTRQPRFDECAPVDGQPVFAGIRDVGEDARR